MPILLVLQTQVIRKERIGNRISLMDDEILYGKVSFGFMKKFFRI